jgi:methylenetetrahydrofolate dehydrogenase (NADP+)/methenyltetrahydrofolate cyclohydrolase
MSAKIIDGVTIAKSMRSECKLRIKQIESKHRVTPALAMILVGSNPASRVYVRNKIRACEDVGIRSFCYEYPTDVQAEIVLKK